MKRSFYSLFCLAALMTLAGCTKEEENSESTSGIPKGALELVAEDSSAPSVKAEVHGTDVYWTNGEPVNVNGESLIIQTERKVASGRTKFRAYIENVDKVGNDGYYYVSIPQNLINSTMMTELMSKPISMGENQINLTINAPNTYQYKLSEDNQEIEGMPIFGMVNASGSSVSMKNLTAAVSVNVTNSAKLPILLDKIEVSVTGDHKRVSGQFVYSITYDNTLESGITNAAPNTSKNNERAVSSTEKKVTMNFPQSTDTEKAAARIAAGAEKKVQVPILPIGSGSTLTITVYGHVDWDKAIEDDPGVKAWKQASYRSDDAQFSVSKSTTNTSSVYTSGIARNVLVSAPMTITMSDAKTNRGLFHIGANKLGAVGSYHYQGLSELTSDQMEYLYTHSDTRKTGEIESWSSPGIYSNQTMYTDVHSVKFYTSDNSSGGFKLEMYRHQSLVSADTLKQANHTFTKYKFTGSPDKYLYAFPAIRFSDSNTNFSATLSSAICIWNYMPSGWGQTGPNPRNQTITYSEKNSSLYVYIITED